jgi:hypothetical protein
VPIVLKSGSLNLLEPSGPVKACNGIVLPLMVFIIKVHMFPVLQCPILPIVTLSKLGVVYESVAFG